MLKLSSSPFKGRLITELVKCTVINIVSFSFTAIPYPPEKVEVWAESTEMISVKWFAPPEWPKAQVAKIDFQIEINEKGTDEWDVVEVREIGDFCLFICLFVCLLVST